MKTNEVIKHEHFEVKTEVGLVYGSLTVHPLHTTYHLIIEQLLLNEQEQ